MTANIIDQGKVSPPIFFETMEGTWNFCGIPVDEWLVHPVTNNLNRLDHATIMFTVLFIMNIFSFLISTISLRKSVNINVKKRIFKKPVEKEYKDVEIQTEDYVEPIPAKPSKIRRKQATLLYPVTVKKIRNGTDDTDDAEASWAPIRILDLRRVKEATVLYGIHSPFVKQLLNSWSTCHQITPKDWLDMATAVLEAGPLMQFKAWLREEAKVIEQRNRARGIDISQDQLLGEGEYADVERQALYDEHTLDLCRMAALNAWDRIEEVGKKLEPFNRVIQSPRETFTDFLHRLTSAVNRTVPDSEARRIIIETLAFENANAQCKRILRPLKARSAPIEDWIRETLNVDLYDDNLVGQLISREPRSSSNVRCFNCGMPGHIKRNCKQGIPRNNTFARNNPNRMPLPSGLCRRCGKGRHWTSECRSTRDRQGNFLPLVDTSRGLSQAPPPGNFLPSGNAPSGHSQAVTSGDFIPSGNSRRGLSKAPKSNRIQSYPAIVEEIPSEDN